MNNTALVSPQNIELVLFLSFLTRGDGFRVRKRIKRKKRKKNPRSHNKASGGEIPLCRLAAATTGLRKGNRAISGTRGWGWVGGLKGRGRPSTIAKSGPTTQGQRSRTSGRVKVMMMSLETRSLLFACAVGTR